MSSNKNDRSSPELILTIDPTHSKTISIPLTREEKKPTKTTQHNTPKMFFGFGFFLKVIILSAYHPSVYMKFGMFLVINTFPNCKVRQEKKVREG